MKNAIIGSICTLIITGILSTISMRIEQARIKVKLDNNVIFSDRYLNNQEDILEKLSDDNIENKIKIAILENK